MVARRVLIVQGSGTPWPLARERHAAWAITVAGGVAEARLILEADPPDVLLLDLVLPDGSGLQVLEALAGRRDGRAPRAYLVGDGLQEFDPGPYAGILTGTLTHPVTAAALEKALRQAERAPQRPAPAAAPGRPILCVDASPAGLGALTAALGALGYAACGAGSLAEATALLARQRVEAVVCAWLLPGAGPPDLLAALQKASPRTPVILVSDYPCPRYSRTLLSLGAADVVARPLEPHTLSLAIEKACLAAAAPPRGAGARRGDPGRGGDPGRLRYSVQSICGESAAIREALARLDRISRMDGNVLVRGETGTGKELFAQALHQLSPRAAGPFVAVNVAAIPEALIESELFGYAGGSFTGARREGHRGKFLAADGGTLFLDEIGDLPPALQAKLLRVLEERQVEPIGSGEPRPVDVRVVAATHRDLRGMVAEGSFRRDLYHRLAVFDLELPPLRQRLEDLPLLVDRFLADLQHRYPGGPDSLAAEALEALSRYAWPGNIRELRNVLEHGYALATGSRIELADLPPHLQRPARGAPGSAPVSAPVSAPGAAPALPPGAGAAADRHPPGEPPRETAEREAIVSALRRARGNKVQAARLLGISRASLYIKLRVYRLEGSEWAS